METQVDSDLGFTRSRLEYLISKSPAVIYVAKVEGDFGATFVSPSVEKLTGYKVHEFVEGYGFWMGKVHPEDLEGILRNVDTILEKDSHKMEYRFLHKNGSYICVLDEFNVIRDASGKPVNLVGHIADITQRKEAEKELHRTHAELELRVEKRTTELKEAQRQIIQRERLSALGQMASGVAHDLNNSLVPIVGLVEMVLAQPRLPFKARKWLELVLTGAKDATNVVRGLRHFYHDDADKVTIERLDLRELVQRTALLTRPMWRDAAQRKGQEIELRVHAETVPQIYGNATELRRALTNLIFNAVEAMPGGGCITMSVYASIDAVFIEVSDVGVGMSEEQLDRCFEPFYTTKEDGSGFGLSTCHGVVERHGGSIRIESKLEQGTKVTIEFPIARYHSRDHAFETFREVALPHWRVLYVDDDHVARPALTAMLEAQGQEVDVVENGFRVMEHLERSDYDLVITDFGMAGIDGLEVTRMVKEIRPSILVMMVSGWDESEISGRLAKMQAGPDWILQKPVTLAELSIALRSLAGNDAEPIDD